MLSEHSRLILSSQACVTLLSMLQQLPAALCMDNTKLQELDNRQLKGPGEKGTDTPKLLRTAGGIPHHKARRSCKAARSSTYDRAAVLSAKPATAFIEAVEMQHRHVAVRAMAAERVVLSASHKAQCLDMERGAASLSLIHISEPTRPY